MNTKPRSVLVLLSGGLDSALNLLEAADQGIDKIHTLTVDYGQKAFPSEKKAALNLAKKFKAQAHVLDLSWVKGFSSSALNKDSKTQIPQQVDLDSLQQCQQSAKSVWVPNRNGLLIHTAATLCDAFKIDQILVGFNKEEAVTFKDNSPEFIKAINEGLKYSSSYPVEVFSYTQDLDKTQMWARAQKLGLKAGEIWSCYNNFENPCLKCESCLRLQRAMEGK